METNRFEKFAKIILYVLAALLPLWFVPMPLGVEFGREVTFTILIVLAAIFWLLSVLTRGEIRYQHSPILYAAALALLVFGLSAIFSKVPAISFSLADPVGERLSTLILGLILMFLAGSILRTREEAGKAVWIMILAGAVAGILSILQILGWSPYQLLVTSNWLPASYQFLQGTDFNVIGTLNGLSLFYAALLAVSLGLLAAGYQLPATGYWLLITAGAVFFTNLLLVNFQTAWMALLGSAIFLFGFLFYRAREVGLPAGSPTSFDWRYWTTLALLIFSVVMMLVRTPLIGGLNIPAEVSPSLRATLNVGGGVFKEGVKSVLLGSGPGTFGLDWSLYKDPSINQNIFWGLRFNQGSSLISTLIPTAGILGLLSFLAFLGVSVFLFLKRMLFSQGEETGLETGLFLGFITLVFAGFLYPANFSLLIMLFLLTGVLALLFAPAESAEGSFGFWNIRERIIKLENPWVVFLSSLAVIFMISLGTATLYFESSRVRAAVAREQGAAAIGRGAIDEAMVHFEKAVLQEPKNFRNYQGLVQARTEKIRGLIGRAAGGENIQQEFQSTVTLAIQNSQAMLALNPEDPFLWRIQGALYELIIPFIQGSEQLAFQSYRRASELEPLSPVAFVDWGRAGLVFADRLQLMAGQASEKNREEILGGRTTTLQDVEKVLQKAVEIKPDFASAHFLLAQTAIRLGNLERAIRATENTRLVAPFDIGVAFQLGLLYYQQDDLAGAEAEFLRAVSLNPNYSNARYFLGLIYERRGEKIRALEEFEKIAALNPDNEEVKKILANLRKGKGALTGIVPPAEPPEKRKEAPVEERETSRRGRR